MKRVRKNKKRKFQITVPGNLEFCIYPEINACYLMCIKAEAVETYVQMVHDSNDKLLEAGCTILRERDLSHTNDYEGHNSIPLSGSLGEVPSQSLISPVGVKGSMCRVHRDICLCVYDIQISLH